MNLLKKITMILIIFILLNSVANGLTVSPSELRIKNSNPNKAYKFIVLVSSQEEGLTDIELKSSDKSVSITPNKFMLNKGEKKSVRIGFYAKSIDPNKNKILIQPHINNVPSENRLMIYIEDTDEEGYDISEINEDKFNFKDPLFLKYVIIGATVILIIMLLGVFIPELKKASKKSKEKVEKSIKKTKRIVQKKRHSKLINKISKTEKKLADLTVKIEKFYENTDKWLRENSDEKHKLE